MALPMSISDLPLCALPYRAIKLPIGSRRISAKPMARSRGATALAMNSLSSGSSSRSSVCGLGTRTSSIKSCFARSREMRASRSFLMSAASIGLFCARQPNPAAFLDRALIDEVRECNVLRNQPRGVNENPLVVAVAPFLLAGNEFVYLGVKLIAGKQARFDRVSELALQHVEFPAVDHDFVHLRPPGRIELAPGERDECTAGLEPLDPADDLGRCGAANRDVGATHDVLNRFLDDHRDAEFFRPFFRECAACLGAARGAADFLEPVHCRKAAQRVHAHG